MFTERPIMLTSSAPTPPYPLTRIPRKSVTSEILPLPTIKTNPTIPSLARADLGEMWKSEDEEAVDCCVELGGGAGCQF